MSKGMLKEKQMPKDFWGEATSTAVYIINRCQIKKLTNKTPQETWPGLKPNIFHFKNLG